MGEMTSSYRVEKFFSGMDEMISSGGRQSRETLPIFFDYSFCESRKQEDVASSPQSTEKRSGPTLKKNLLDQVSETYEASRSSVAAI